MAALEVGTKDYVVTANPTNTRVSNHKAPWIVDMLWDDVPAALQKHRPSDFDTLKVYLPPKTMRDRIGEASQHRNTFVHQIQQPTNQRYAKAIEQLSVHYLRSLTNTIQDLLWIYDYFLGNDWTIPRLSWETNEELEAAAGVNTLPHLEGAKNRISVMVGTELSTGQMEVMERLSKSYQDHKRNHKPEDDVDVEI